MKVYRLLLIFLFATVLASCSTSSGPAYTVGGDERGNNDQNVGAYINTSAGTDNVDFNKFKTYTWASQVRDEKNGVYFLNDLLFKAMVRDAIDHEMAARGYAYRPNDGDLIVNFRVFDQPTEIRSNDNLGNNYWATTEPYAYNTRNEVKLDRGSILMQMVDREKGEQVWQGYVSGLTDGNIFNKNKDRVYEAVAQIFSKYQHRGDKL